LPNPRRRNASAITIGLDVSDEGIETLVANGLDARVPDLCRVWRQRKVAALKKCDEDRVRATKELAERLGEREQQLKATILSVAAKRVVQHCP
jgi:phosphoribosylaminoimidazole-succinocarboxamide synthase